MSFSLYSLTTSIRMCGHYTYLYSSPRPTGSSTTSPSCASSKLRERVSMWNNMYVCVLFYTKPEVKGERKDIWLGMKLVNKIRTFQDELFTSSLDNFMLKFLCFILFCIHFNIIRDNKQYFDICLHGNCAIILLVTDRKSFLSHFIC